MNALTTETNCSIIPVPDKKIMETNIDILIYSWNSLVNKPMFNDWLEAATLHSFSLSKQLVNQSSLVLAVADCQYLCLIVSDDVNSICYSSTISFCDSQYSYSDCNCRFFYGMFLHRTHLITKLNTRHFFLNCTLELHQIIVSLDLCFTPSPL